VERQCWVKAINRKDSNDPSKIWTPKPDSRICSCHFKDSRPTDNNPYPTLNLGHIQTVITPRKPPRKREMIQHPSPKKKFKSVSTGSNDKTLDVSCTVSENSLTESSTCPSVLHSYISHEHNYDDCSGCSSCTSKDATIKKLKKKTAYYSPK
jgi:hypothetical protein